jgi:hypothetical protein
MLFIQGARTVLFIPQAGQSSFGPWLTAAARRLRCNILTVALANKLARIAPTVLLQGRDYQTAFSRLNRRCSTTGLQTRPPNANNQETRIPAEICEWIEEMDKRSDRHIRDLVAPMAFQGLDENEIGCARLSMMARAQDTPFEGPNRARPIISRSLTPGLHRTASSYRGAITA